MRIILISKYIAAVIAIFFFFIDWHIALLLGILSCIIHVIPRGPRILISTIVGFLLVAGLLYLFIDWRIGVLLIILAFELTRFNNWATKTNIKYYDKNNYRSGRHNKS